MEKADDLFEKFSRELEMDTQLDATNVLDKQYSLPNIRHKWMYRLRQCQRTMFKLVDAKNEYIEKAIQNTPIQLSKAKINRSIESDEKYKQLLEEIHSYESLIQYLDININKNLTSMGFDIKNIVELLKMES